MEPMVSWLFFFLSYRMKTKGQTKMRTALTGFAQNHIQTSFKYEWMTLFDSRASQMETWQLNSRLRPIWTKSSLMQMMDCVTVVHLLECWWCFGSPAVSGPQLPERGSLSVVVLCVFIVVCECVCVWLIPMTLYLWCCSANLHWIRSYQSLCCDPI